MSKKLTESEEREVRLSISNNVRIEVICALRDDGCASWDEVIQRALKVPGADYIGEQEVHDIASSIYSV